MKVQYWLLIVVGIALASLVFGVSRQSAELPVGHEVDPRSVAHETTMGKHTATTKSRYATRRLTPTLARSVPTIASDRAHAEAAAPGSADSFVGAPEHDDEHMAFNQRLEHAFEAEAKDPEWASDAELRAEEVLDAIVPTNSQYRGLECRASLCRVEIHHEREDGHGQLASAAMSQKLTWKGPGAMTRHVREHGDVTIAFLGKAEEVGDAESIWTQP